MFAGNYIMPLLSWIYRLLRWFIGGIFIYSGATKLVAPQTFAVLIEAYGIVPEGLVMPVSVILPVLEVIAGIGLLLDRRGSLAVITGLLLLFAAILGYGIGMGLDVDCGCFGPEDPEAEAFHGLRPALYRDMAMLAAVAFLYGWRRYRRVRPRKTIPLSDKWLTRVDQKIADEH
jgi:uncharacterized membrane protein